MTAPVEDGIYTGIPESVYHADRDSLSSSGARLLLSVTPLEFAWQMANQTRKKVWDYGSICHKLVLGEGGEFLVLDPAVHGLTAKGEPSDRPANTSMWRQTAEQARADGLTPIPLWDYDTAALMAAEVHRHALAGALLADGQPELSGWWTDPETGVRLRFRPDFIPSCRLAGGRPVVVDYKTTTSANPVKFARSAADFGYHCQGGWYLDGLAATQGIDDAAFVLIAQSKTPPYVVSVNQFEYEDIERGRSQNRRAIRLYDQCRQSDSWPGYDGLNTLRLPAWARRDIDEENTMEGEW